MILYDAAMVHGPRSIDPTVIRLLQMKPERRIGVVIIRKAVPVVRDRTADAVWEWTKMLTYDIFKLTVLGAGMEAFFQMHLK